jgi:P27 family predicted phage terminase small subunit
MKGRKPKPTFLKLVTGNPGRRPLNQNEPQPEKAIPTVPAHLSDVAKVEWGRIANELHDLGMLTRLDRAVLAAYCQAYSDWVEAEAKLQQYGKVIMSPKKTTTKRGKDGSEVTESTGGYPMQSPYLAIRNKSLELMNKFAIEFGMSPSSRTRVNANGEGESGRGGTGEKSKYF